MATCADCYGPCSTRARRCAPCAQRARLSGPPSKATVRRRAQRRYSTEGAECEGPGPHGGPLERHHPDIDEAPDEVVLLCLRCHAREDYRLGKLRLPQRKPGQAMPAPEAAAVALPDPGPDADAARPLVHVVGAPGTGKSTLVQRWCDEQGWTLHEFDRMRRESGESDVAIAGRLVRALRLDAGPAIVESSGLNARVSAAVLVAVGRWRRPGAVVVLHCDSAEMERRLRERPKAPIWGDRDKLVRWSLGAAWRLASRYPASVATWVDTGGSPDAAYARLRSALLPWCQ